MTTKVDAAKLADTMYKQEKDAKEKLRHFIALNKQQLKEGLNWYTTVLGK